MSKIDLVRQLIERGHIQGDLSVADELAGSTIIEHQYLAPRGGSGAETLKLEIEAARKELPGFEYSIEDIVEVGDKVWSRIKCTGTDQGTGRPVSMEIMDICRFENEKIAEHWGIPDRFAYMHQLGMLPDGP